MRTRRVNDRGIGFAGIQDEHIRDIRVYDQDGQVLVWVEVFGRDFLQYLTAEESMAFAKAFERCAIQALKDSSA